MRGATEAGEQPDFESALRLLNGNRALLHSVMARFTTDAPVEIAGLADAIARGRAAEVRERAHRFKGSLLYTGYPPAADAAAALQRLGDSGDLAGAPAVHAALAAYVARICDAWGDRGTDR